MVEKDKIEVLRDLLFTNDRAYVEKIVQRIANVEKTVDDKERYHAEVGPIVKNQLADFKKDLPSTITAALKVEIATHKDEVADVLFPILGKMIKKYVSQEVKLLTQKMNVQIGVKGWKERTKSWFRKGKKKKPYF